MDQARHVADHCLAVRLRMIHRVVTGYYDHALEPLGLTVGQLNVLTLLASRGPLTPGEIARILEMDPSTVTRNVERMAGRGTVRRRSEGPGHTYQLEVTPAGQDLVAKALEPWQEAQDKTRALLGDEGCAALFATARRLWKGE